MLHKNFHFRNRAKRKHKTHLKNLYERIGYFPSGSNKKENDNGVVYYTRYYRGKASQYLKRVSAKRIRRTNKHIEEDEVITKERSSYNKLFDFWWELY